MWRRVLGGTRSAAPPLKAGTMTDEDVRMAKTEALFRDVNERIAEASEHFGSGEAEFMCECADPACADRCGLCVARYNSGTL